MENSGYGFYNYMSNLYLDTEKYNYKVEEYENQILGKKDEEKKSVDDAWDFEILNPSEKELKSKNKTSDEVVNSFIADISDLNKNLKKDIENITWMVEILDPEKHKEIVGLAMHLLCNLNAPLNSTNLILDNISNENKSEELENLVLNEKNSIKEVYKGFNDAILLLINNNSKELAEYNLNPGNIEGSLKKLKAINKKEDKETSIYDIFSNYTSSISNSMVFSPGRFYNIIPSFSTSYVKNAEKDNPKALENVFSLILGQKIDTEMSPFKVAEVIVLDKYNKSVLAPLQFAKDLTRSYSFTLNQKEFPAMDNGETLFVKEPNEVARNLYEIFGKEGAIRIMNLCTQTIFPSAIENLLFPLIFNGGSFQAALPGKRLVPGEDTLGMMYSVEIKEDTVEIIAKQLMKLNASGDSTFKANCVIKISTTIPFANLIGDIPEGSKPEDIGLHVEEAISTLVFDNPQEAHELARKF